MAEMLKILGIVEPSPETGNGWTHSETKRKNIKHKKVTETQKTSERTQGRCLGSKDKQLCAPAEPEQYFSIF